MFVLKLWSFLGAQLVVSALSLLLISWSPLCPAEVVDMKLGVLVALAAAALMLGPSEGRRIPARRESNLPADDVIANVLS